MFWQFDTGFVSQIDTLLDKEDVSLKDLMEEEDILQECKSQNPKLIQFIIRPSILQEMVNLITSEPPNDLDERIRYKYANIASEIMTSDVNDIIEALVSDESMLTKLYNFIDTDKQLNPLLASFFSKLMGLLFIKKTTIVFEFLKSKDFVSLLLAHIETSAIMDLILRLIVSVDNIDLKKIIIKWFFENDLIGKLLNIFKTDVSPQRHTNVAQLICDVIKTTREQLSIKCDKSESDPLLDSLESTETVSQLLENMLSNRTESSLVGGLSIIQSLLEYKRHCMNNNIQTVPTPQTPVQQPSEFEAMPQCYAPQSVTTSQTIINEVIAEQNLLDTERLTKSVKLVEAAILPRLQDFSHLLESPPPKEAIRTTTGLIEKPLGATRLEVAHLITALLSSNNSEISEKLAKMNTLPILMDLFFEYPWNNFLHKHIEQIITCILNNSKSNTNNNECEESMSSNVDCSVLVIKLLTECQLIDRIIKAFDSLNSKSNENEIKLKSYRPGYFGHLVIIANIIKDKCDPHLLKAQLTLDTYDQWNAFVEQVLEPTNKTICTPLVNEMPHSVNMDEEPIRHQESALQQAFIEYQMQQMTRNLCTQIAFAANEFTEVNESIPNQINTLSRVNFNFDNQLQQKDKSLEFEKICSERAKASLDSNDSSDDEDLWEDREITFTQTTNLEHKKTVSLISEDSPVFPEHSFDYNTNNQMNRLLTSMDVDQNDPWTSEPVNCSTISAIPMDTSNPWESLNANKSEGNSIKKTNNSSSGSIEADSWADFSSFPTTEFSSSIIQLNSSNVTTSTMVSPVVPIHGTAVAESTTGDEGVFVSQVASSSSTDSEVNFEFSKNMVEDQENVITSSTCDSLQNGPNS